MKEKGENIDKRDDKWPVGGKLAYRYLSGARMGASILRRVCWKSLILLGRLSLSGAHAQLIPFSFRQSLQICAWDRCSAGRIVTQKEWDARRVRCAEAMERGGSLMFVFLLLAPYFVERKETYVEENRPNP